MADLRGGDKLLAALRKITENVSRSQTVRVGFLEGATYPDGTPVAMVAAIQEFGAPGVNIPPRPFFRDMIAAKSPTWGDAMMANLKATNYDANATLQRMGEGVKGQLQQSITQFEGTPLKPDTVKAKGSAKQLVDTGHMLNSVDYEVK